MRANYQAAIWHQALDPNSQIPSPESHRWLIRDDQVDINWMSLPPAPEALLELILCTTDCTTVSMQKKWRTLTRIMPVRQEM